MNLKEIDTSEFSEVSLSYSKELDHISGEIRKVERMIQKSPFCTETFTYPFPDERASLMWCGIKKRLLLISREGALGAPDGRPLIETRVALRVKAFSYLEGFLDELVRFNTGKLEKESV